MFKTQEVEPFLTELKALLKKHSMELYANADAADDTNLHSWIEIDKVTINEHGRRVETTIFKGEEL
jgi:hypothetical protein